MNTKVEINKSLTAVLILLLITIQGSMIVMVGIITLLQNKDKQRSTGRDRTTEYNTNNIQ